MEANNPERPAQLGDISTGIRKVVSELRGRDVRSQEHLRNLIVDKDEATQNAVLQTAEVWIPFFLV